MDTSAKGKLEALAKELGIELTEEFDRASVARNGRVDVMFKSDWRKKQDHFLELLAPLKQHGWRFETALAGFRALPPRGEAEEDPALGVQRQIGNVHDAVKLLDSPSEGWRSAKLRNNRVIVPNQGISEHHQMILANNVALLERAGWTMVYNRSPRGGIESYELTPPIDYAPTADVKTALQRALKLPKVQSHWINLGQAKGKRSLKFDKRVSGNAYINAANAAKSLFGTGWQAETVEGREQSITLIAPESAITS